MPKPSTAKFNGTGILDKIRSPFWDKSRGELTALGEISFVVTVALSIAATVGFFMVSIRNANFVEQEKEKAAKRAELDREQASEKFISDLFKEVDEASSVECDGYRYKLTDDHIVTAKHGPLRYVFDFKAEVVVVKPAVDTDEKELGAVRLFSEFQNAALINESREMGLLIAEEYQCFHYNLPEETLRGANDSKIEDLLHSSKAFENRYALQSPSTPEMQ